VAPVVVNVSVTAVVLAKPSDTADAVPSVVEPFQRRVFVKDDPYSVGTANIFTGNGYTMRTDVVDVAKPMPAV